MHRNFISTWESYELKGFTQHLIEHFCLGNLLVFFFSFFFFFFGIAKLV